MNKKIKVNKTQKKSLIDIVRNITGKKLNLGDDLFTALDSLEIMNLFTSLEKKYKKKLNLLKILNKKKITIQFLKRYLN